MRDDGSISDDELEALFQPLTGRRLAVAVSGGIDSIVLLHLVSRWMELGGSGGDRLSESDVAPPLTAAAIGMPRHAPILSARAEWHPPHDGNCLPRGDSSPPVVVLTVDHGVRSGSADDAQFVADVARRLGLPCQVLRWQHETHTTSCAPAAGALSGLQEKARAARYDLMADAIEDEVWKRFAAGDYRCHPLGSRLGQRIIVTAHHREDLVETFLMRLHRGSGLDGLAAMRSVETRHRPPATARPYPTRVQIARPLLDVPKSRLEATARRLGLQWREDPSNDDPRFERTQLRRKAPERAAFGLEAEALHRSIRRLRDARDALENTCRQWISGAIGRRPVLETNDGLFAEIAIGHDGPPPELLLRIVRQTICAFGGGHPEPELDRLESLLADVAIALQGRARGAPPGSPELQMASAPRFSPRTLGGCRVDGCFNSASLPPHLRVWREAGRKPLPELVLQPGDGGWWDDRFAITVSDRAPAAVGVRALGVAGWAELKRRKPALRDLRRVPSGAAAALPGIWRGETLVTAPYFDASSRLPSLARMDFDGEERLFYKAVFAPAGRFQGYRDLDQGRLTFLLDNGSQK